MKTSRDFVLRMCLVASGLLLGGVSVSYAEVLAVSHADFSTAAQGTNGVFYGYYDGPDSTTHVFVSGVGQMQSGVSGSLPAWYRSGSGTNLPNLVPYMQHPGPSGEGSKNAVRRYMVGEAGEPSFTGTVRVVGRFYDLDQGSTNVFVAVDPDGDAGVASRTFPFPSTHLVGPTPKPFDFTIPVSPGATIDIGVISNADDGYDTTGAVAWIVTEDVAVPTHAVANSYNSVPFSAGSGSEETRGLVFALLTDGVLSGADIGSFDTLPASQYTHAGLLYSENSGSGKVTRFNSVRIDVTTAGDFAELPHLFVLRHNSDPGSLSPAQDERYVQLPVTAVRTSANAAGQPYYTFDLTSLPESQRTGYGFTVFGRGTLSGGAIAVSEISADAVRVSDAGYLAAKPTWMEYSGHRYGLSFTRGNWEQTELEGVSYGGHLVSLNSAAENNWVFDALGRDPLTFIGLRQNPLQTNVEPNGGWTWMDGTVLSEINGSNVPGVYRNWNDGTVGGSEPNHSGGAGEDYGVFAPLYFSGRSTWGDVKNAGFPENSNFRGIIELPTPAGPSDQRNHQITVSGKANIFGAGQTDPTPTVAVGSGGVAAPYLPVYGGETVRLTASSGTVNSGASGAGAVVPDGERHPTRRCDITGVAGISGYLNRNNSAHLVGVFVGAAPLTETPARLDFSADATGEDFELIGPGLGQVFFIGDGLTPGGKVQEFEAPAGATRLHIGFPDAYEGNNTYVYTGPPNGYGDNSGSWSIRLAVTPTLTPQVAGFTFPESGGKLAAVGGTGPTYTWALIGGSLPPHLELAPNGSGLVISSGQPRVNGSYNFTVQVTDTAGATGEKAFTIVIADPIPVRGGLVAWYPGENGVNEIIGGRHGSLKNGAGFGTGRVGRGFALDGVNDYLEVADHDTLDLTGDLTIEAWVQATATNGERTIVSKRNGDNADVSYVLFTRDGILRFASRTGGGSFFDESSGVAVPAGLSHVAVTIVGGSLKFYLNGAEVASVSVPTRPATSGPLTIGGTITDTFPSSSPDGSWAGVIDDLSFYSRGLSAGEIAAIQLAGPSGKARYDAARDYSTSTANGLFWSYRWLPSSVSLSVYDPAEASSRLLTMNAGFDGNGVHSWSGDAYVSFNPKPIEVAVNSGGTQYTWLPQQLGMGPNSGEQRPVVRWKAPQAGLYAVSGTFYGADTRPTSVDVHIYHNSIQLSPPDKRTVNSYRGDGVSHTQVIQAAANDTVDFVVGAGTGGWTYDSAGLAASVVFLGTLPEIVQTEFPKDLRQSNVPWKLTATGGTAPYTFAVVDGVLPGDLVLDEEGNISGELVELGHFRFTVEVTDAEQQSSQREFAVIIADEVGVIEGITSWFPGELHAYDVVGGKAGIVVGATVGALYGQGKSGRGFVFDGVDDAVEVEESGVLNELPLTIETWIKPELRSGNVADFWPTNIISGDRANYGGHGIGANVFVDGSHLVIEVQHTSPAQAFRRVPGDHFEEGQWAHIALVLTSGNAKTYVNGELVDDFDFSQGGMDADPFFRIGRHNEDAGYPVGRRFFKGVIDELSTFNRALTDEEILGIYNADVLGKKRDDAARDFFTDTNEAGQLWQYGQMGTGQAPDGTTFARYATVGSENALGYWRNGTAPDPNVIKNQGDVAYLHWPAGQLSLHPGPGPERIYSAVRWKAPEAGTYAFFAQGTRLNTQAGVSTLHLVYSGSGTIGDGAKTILQTQPSDRVFGTKFVQAGETVDFVVGSYDDFGYDAVGITPSVVLLEAAQIASPVTSLAIQTEDPPVTSARWYFTATREPDDAEATLAVEYSTTPAVESSWISLQTFLSSPLLVNTPVGSDVWTCDPFVTLPAGAYYFRVVTTAPGYGRQVSATFGNESLVGGSGEEGPIVVGDRPAPPAVTNFKIITSQPAAAGKKWVFRVDHPNTPGLRLLVQYSLTPDDPNSWRYLPGSADLERPDPTGKGNKFWELTVSRLSIPGGNVFFRVVSNFFGAPDGFSAPFGAASISGAKAGTTGPIVVKNPAALSIGTLVQLQNADGSRQPIVNNLVHEGELVAYTIQYRNHGEASARDATLSVYWPEQFEAVSATGTTMPINALPSSKRKGIIGVKIDLGDLEPSQTLASHTVVLRVKSGVKTPGRGVINLLGTVLGESADFPDVTADLPFIALADALTAALRVVSTDVYMSKGASIPLDFTVSNKSPVAVNNATATLIIPPGAFWDDAYWNANRRLSEDANIETEFTYTTENFISRVSKVTFRFGTIPANESRGVFFLWHTAFDLGMDTLITGNPTKNDPGYTFSANHGTTGKLLYGVGDSLTVFLSNDIVRPPQLDLGKDVEGELLDGRRTHGVYRYVDPMTANLERGALVRPGGEATFYVTYKNVGEGRAKAVVIRDVIPPGCTLIPDSIRLNDQAVSIGGDVKLLNSASVLVGPNEGKDPKGSLRDLRTARRFTVRVGDLEAGQGGMLTYRVVASSYSFSSKKLTPLAPGVDMEVGKNTNGYKKFGKPIMVVGANCSSESLVSRVNGSPAFMSLLVVRPRELELVVKNPFGRFYPGNQIRYSLKYHNKGQLPAYNCFIDVPIPVGTKGDSVVFVETDTATERDPTSGEQRVSPEIFYGVTGTYRIQIGTLQGGETREVAVFLRLDTPLHSSLTNADYIYIYPRVDGYDAAVSSARTVKPPPPPKLVGLRQYQGTAQLGKPKAAKPWIGRIVPMSATKGGNMEMTILFGNEGDEVATSCNVAMQIPFETTFISTTPVKMTRPADALNQNNFSDTITTQTARTEKKGTRIERIVVDLPRLEPHATGSFTFTVKVADGFKAAAVEDSSCRIAMSGRRDVVAIPIATQVRSANGFFSVFEGIAAQFSGFGSWVARGFKPTVQEEFKKLTGSSQFFATSGLNTFVMRNGAVFAPLGFNRALIFGPSQMVAAGGGNMVAAGGLNMVAAGGGNLIGLKNVPGFGNLSASSLVAAIPQLVAAGGGNMVAAGGLNLIGMDGSTLIGNDGSTLIGLDGSTLIGLDGGTLIGLDGSTLAAISSNGGSLTFTPTGGGAAIRTTQNPAEMVAAGGGNIVAAGGGNMVAAGGGNMVAAGGGNMVAAGAGN